MVLFIKSCVSELLGRKLNNNTGLKNKGAMKQPIVFPKRLLFWKEKKAREQYLERSLEEEVVVLI